MKHQISIILALLLCLPLTLPAQVKVACVGNSITFGAGIRNREKDAYPSQLAQMLGDGYDVRNFGVSGRTMIQKGGRSYMAQSAYKDALGFKPDILVVKLGTNDSNAPIWKYKADFVPDMTAMLEAFRKANSNVKIFLCYPVAINSLRDTARDRIITDEIIPMIDGVVGKFGAAVIDLHTPTVGRPELYTDVLHPNEEGAHLMAAAVCKAITGKDTDHEIWPFPGRKSVWSGYDRYDFSYKKRKVIAVCPQKPIEGNPWVWRPAFFGSFALADKELLKRGFHIVFFDMTHQYGAPSAIRTGTDFYNTMVSLYGLSPKVTVEGLSRGGYYALRWAEANPDKVACLYLDNPVCDMFSWPGRKNTKLWEGFTKNWNLPDDIKSEEFDGNPINNLAGMAAHHVPVLAVCGDSDKTVPFEENMKPLRDAYLALGGPIELIIKPGADHHPHGLDNPEPIVDFIVRNQPEYRSRQHLSPRGSLANSFIKFEKERKGRVAFFGGSITEMKGWRNMIQQQLKQRFPYTEFDFVDAGIPSTGTTPHAFRMSDDVLSHGEIDLLFIEGAVNDHTNGFGPQQQIRGMEGVVRHALQANPYTDIVMLHFVYEPFLGMFASGQTPDVILNHERVANHYLVPSINCAAEVAQRIGEGELTWKQFGGVHPAWAGHKYYAADIQALWDIMWSIPDSAAVKVSKHEIPRNMLDKFSYTKGRFADLKDAKLGKGWQIVDRWQPGDKTKTRPGFADCTMLVSDTPGSEFTFKFRGRAVGLFMACGPRSGKIEYSIDGGQFRTLDTFTKWSKNLYLPWLYVLNAQLKPDMDHILTLRVSEDHNARSKGTELVIRNIVINE